MSSSINIPMLTFKGEPGLLSFVGSGNLDEPMQLEVEIERVHITATG